MTVQREWGVVVPTPASLFSMLYLDEFLVDIDALAADCAAQYNARPVERIQFRWQPAVQDENGTYVAIEESSKGPEPTHYLYLATYWVEKVDPEKPWLELV